MKVYFDLSKEAPGPIVFNQEELTQAILNIGEELEKCAGRKDAFLSKYLTLFLMGCLTDF